LATQVVQKFSLKWLEITIEIVYLIRSIINAGESWEKKSETGNRLQTRVV